MRKLFPNEQPVTVESRADGTKIGRASCRERVCGSV